mmetsp:Transcript_24726/g.68843  ORF Transcript_24726/g.68843 Transcript_24726/m.68843 type:complete len:111 (+) Transcript_24726:254-586(+)
MDRRAMRNVMYCLVIRDSGRRLSSFVQFLTERCITPSHLGFHAHAQQCSTHSIEDTFTASQDTLSITAAFIFSSIFSSSSNTENAIAFICMHPKKWTEFHFDMSACKEER